MTTEEIIKKAREMGLSEDEISKFVENEAIAKKYGFEDEYSSINVKIDKKKQAQIEAGADPDSVLCDDEECHCDDCEECHCEDGNCCCHEHEHN